MTTLSGAEQRPFLRSPVIRRHSRAQMATGVTRCFLTLSITVTPCANDMLNIKNIFHLVQLRYMI